MSSSRLSQFVEVQLEIGHRANLRTKPHAQGHTHDWTVFVRGPENNNVQHFVEKVVFYLHESFPKPKRVIKEPPYEVSESGYAGFELPIEVYFRNKDDPRKINFEYDLYLRTDSAVSHSRREKLTFQNPSAEFKKKLLKAGGVTNDSNAKPSSEERLSSSNAPVKTTKNSYHSNEPKKSKSGGLIPGKDKSSGASSSSSSSSSTSSTSNTNNEKPKAPVQSQFTDLFGPPIQARTSDLANYTKIKDNSTRVKSSSANAKGSGSETNRYAHKNTHQQENDKNSSKTSDNSKPAKESKATREGTKSKNDKENFSKKKSNASSSPVSSAESLDKKSSEKISSTKRRRPSTSSSSSSATGSESAAHRESPKPSLLKEHDSKRELKKQKTISKDVVNSGSGVKKQSSTSTKISFSDNNTNTTIEIKSVKKEKLWENDSKKSKSKEFKSSEMKSSRESNSSSSFLHGSSKNSEKSQPSLTNNNKNLKVPKNKYSSSQRDSSISPSSATGSLTPGRINSSASSVHAPIAAMIAEMEQESLSPLSSAPASPLHFESQKRKNPSEDSDSCQSPKRQGHLYKETNQTSPNKLYQPFKRKHESMDRSADLHESNETSQIFRENVNYKDLIELQQRINELTDCDLLQKIADVIEESGLFQLTSTTFDFDLMKLDQPTVRKLKSCLI